MGTQKRSWGREPEFATRRTRQVLEFDQARVLFRPWQKMRKGGLLQSMLESARLSCCYQTRAWTLRGLVEYRHRGHGSEASIAALIDWEVWNHYGRRGMSPRDDSLLRHSVEPLRGLVKDGFSASMGGY